MERILVQALGALLVATWLLGGVTQDSTSLNEVLELVALPVLALSAWALCARARIGRWTLAGVIVALLICAVPALQLLPISASAWGAPSARAALAADLDAAGVQLAVQRWSLSPTFTEQSLWALLPALTAFVAALAVPKESQRSLLKLVLVLVLANVLFAFFQVGLPYGSPLRLYEIPQGFGGLFANTNHQATALIIGMVVATGLAVDARKRVQHGKGNSHATWWYAAIAGACLLLVPLCGARAGVAIELPALAAIILATGVLPWRRIGHSWKASLLAFVVVATAIAGVWSALGWLQVDDVDEIRHVLRHAGMAMAQAEAPLGSGMGTLVPVFEQSAPPDLMLPQYINHVHNEYVQWWLTGGVLGAFAMIVALGFLLAVGWVVARKRMAKSISMVAPVCYIAILVTLVHSWVDYPLRTTTLMTTTAMLAGLMLASLGMEATPRRHLKFDDTR